MKNILCIISIMLSLTVLSQHVPTKKQLKTIEKHSQLLTGKWTYIGSFKKGKKTQDLSDIIFFDSIEKFKLTEIEFQLEKNGKGSYKEIFANRENSRMNLPHDPQPQLLYRNRKYILKMNEMFGHFYVVFNIKKDRLILKREDMDFEKRYSKILESELID